MGSRRDVESYIDYMAHWLDIDVICHWMNTSLEFGLISVSAMVPPVNWVQVNLFYAVEYASFVVISSYTEGSDGHEW